MLELELVHDLIASLHTDKREQHMQAAADFIHTQYKLFLPTQAEFMKLTWETWSKINPDVSCIFTYDQCCCCAVL